MLGIVIKLTTLYPVIEPAIDVRLNAARIPIINLDISRLFFQRSGYVCFQSTADKKPQLIASFRELLQPLQKDLPFRALHLIKAIDNNVCRSGCLEPTLE